MKITNGFGVVFQSSMEEVFSLIGTAEGLNQWLPAVELRLRKTGEFRTGDFRVFETPLGRIKEEITQSDPSQFLSYRIAEGQFLEGLEGQITLTQKDDVVRLDWEVSIADEEGIFKTQAVARAYSTFLFTSLQYYAWKQRGKGWLARVRAA